MNKLPYPREPNSICKENHYKLKLHYNQLYINNMFEYTQNPYKTFSTLGRISIDKILGICDYYGEVDHKAERPHGLGLAVDTDGDIYEGLFRNGGISEPRLEFYENGYTYAYINTNEGCKY